MKVYIVIETSENIIRFATLRKDIAEQICQAFSYMGLRIEEYDLVGLDK